MAGWLAGWLALNLSGLNNTMTGGLATEKEDPALKVHAF